MKKLLYALFVSLLLPAIALARNPEGKPTDSREATKKLNSLVRGEISAVETYRQALEKVTTEPGADTLRSYMKDHEKAAEELRAEVVRLGGTPSMDSGAWGAWAQTVQGAAKIFGNRTALTALRNGERHGLKQYEEAIDNDQISNDIRDRIRTTFVNNQRAHIDGLTELINEIDRRE